MALTIRKISMPVEKYPIKCPYTMNPTRVVIHNTAGDNPAENEIRYMQYRPDQVSFHYAVDDKEAVQGVELWRNGWHAGDGANGKGNREGIAIEICYSKSGGTKFAKAEENAAELAARLLIDFAWDTSHLTTHKACSGKNCPHRTLELGWDRFVQMVEEKRKLLLGIKTNAATERMTLNGYTIERASDFAAKYWDKSKKKGDADSYINGGFFAPFAENGMNFTLPVGNLVADIDLSSVPVAAAKYLEKHVVNRKLRWSVNHNAGTQYYGKRVTTLVLPRAGSPYMAELNAPPSDCRYAISGIPVIRDGVDVSYKNFVLPQGWDTSPFYATSRNLIGIKGTAVYIVSGKSRTENFVSSSEVYDALKPFGFEQLCALDGGGSYYHKYKGKADAVWGDRNVNNLIVY